MICKACEKDTTNPSFCSRSCAAKYNNVLYPKRKPERNCPRCDGPLNSGRRYCAVCWAEVRREKSIENWLNTSLADMRGKGNANAGGRYPYIRNLSRTSYMRSGRPMECYVCGYSYHVDICHITDVKDFPTTATVGEINAPTNLVALCKNHHYEFDSGLLKIEF